MTVYRNAGSVWWDAAKPADIAPLLGHRRWWRHNAPFPHVRAVNVFRPAIYAELEDAFLAWQETNNGGRPLEGHDLRGTTISDTFAGPLRLFASPGWHRLIARAFGLDSTPYVNLGLHHHEPGGAPGFPHTDLNPAWFPQADPSVAGAPSSVVLADPTRVDYTTGRVLTPGTWTVCVVRAVAVLFYLANPEWEPGHGGETGLYRGNRDDPEDPVARVPPHSNTLLAFECTPWSFHGFVGGGEVGRNSVVEWLHRPAEEARRRWGEHSIVAYGGPAARDGGS